MSILEVNNVSIRYLTGDFKDIGLKEYVMRRLTKNYRVKEFWSDRHITFSLEKGEMLGIIGSNGAGKSTLLKVVSGIMEPTEGCVKREGNIAALLELTSGFDGDLTVKENAYLRGAMLGYTRKFMDETYDQIIEFAELKDFQDKPFKQLSSGMKSRLAFAIASMVQPDILILDEVLAVGDGAFRQKSEAKMREIICNGTTTILVSHALSQIEELCTKVLWLEKGEQIAFGDTHILCVLYQQYLDQLITLEEAKRRWAAYCLMSSTIALITDEPVTNYVLDVIAQNPQIKVETFYLYKMLDQYSYKELTDKLSNMDSPWDALVVAVQEIKQIRNVISEVVSRCRQISDKVKLIVVRPSCISDKHDFITENRFVPSEVIELPFSDITLSLLSERLHSWALPSDIADEVYSTKSGIQAYRFKKLYVKILQPEIIGLIACAYNADGIISNSCTNGRTHFCEKMQGSHLPLNDKNTIYIDNVCPLVRQWTRNYSHFVTEVCDKILIAEEVGFTGKYMLYHSNDIETITSLIGISSDRILWIETQDIDKVFLISNAFDVQGFTMPTEKTILSLCSKYQGVAENLMIDDDTEYPRLLYVPRVGSRKLLRAEKIIEKYGFYTFIPEEHSLEEEIKYFYNADIVLCPHGAALTNALFMKMGAALVETCPCNWSESTVGLIIAKHKNLLYRKIVESTNANPETSSGQFRDYSVNNMLLDQTIKELIDKERVTY